jgi:CRP/FNR family transcriptional regulator, polysaccharide utilization system transcription regulator
MADKSEVLEMNCHGCFVSSPLFSLLTKEELELMHRNKHSVKFKQGEMIRKQGTSMSHVLSINSGLAKLYLEGSGTINAILRIVKPTNFIGGPGIYYDQMHHFSVAALVETRICFIDIQVFKQIMSQNKVFANEFLKDLSIMTISVYKRLINLLQKKIPGRMADTLLYLSEEIKNGSKLITPISYQNLADLSGMSKDSAIKIIRDFQNETLISYDKHELAIIDLEALKRISLVG